MADDMGESATLNLSESTSFQQSVSKDMNLEEGINNVAVTKKIVSNNEDNYEERQSDAHHKPGQIMLERSGTTETDIESPLIIERMAGLKDKAVCPGKKETVMGHMTQEKNPYERAMCYLHQHSLPSLFQYMTINLAYQRPEDAIGFMIEEVSKRNKGQHE